MSLGYQKGRFWVPDERHAAYADRDGYKTLMTANVLAGFGTNVEYSHNAKTYMAEIVTIERFASSQRPYVIKHNNAYGPHPMIALTRAIRESGRASALCLACCLEIECWVLLETVRDAKAKAEWRARVREKIETVLSDLGSILDLVPENTLFNRMTAMSYSEDDDL